MAKNIKDIAGQRFGLLIVEAIDDESTARGQRAYWFCRCDCGNRVTVRGESLRKEKTKSCGCLQKKTASAIFKKHGMHGSPTYRSWNNMVQRCTNPKAFRYSDYGGRGISVCQRWIDSFENFFSDMGERPSGTSIDRIDVNRGYEKENCRWASDIEQLNNTRRNKFITFNGETLTVSQWGVKIGGDRDTVKGRLQEGWSIERAILTPLVHRKKKTDHGLAHS